MTKKAPPRDLRERTFAFAVQIVKLCRHLELRNGVARTLSRQLLRAGTSIGANVEEAQAAQSRPDFINKNGIALKEARETHYWLRLLIASGEVQEQPIAPLRQESGELMRILGAIVVSSRRDPDENGR
ncbi:MAG: four helix bundle protein [Candidatus Acidiferrales bacterium]